MLKQKPYCLMPWIHFHLGNQSYIKACCVSNITYGNLNNDSLDLVWNSDTIKALRSKFLSGEADKRCAVCINRELSGAKSIRQETHEKFDYRQIEEFSDPIYFDIRFSNKCNFRCRTCWHGSSSSWYKESKELKINVAQQAVIENISDFNLFIKKLGPSLLKAKEIYFAGGEPLVTTQHYLLLEWLIEHGSKDVLLRYNTNFSHLKYKHYDVLEYWKKFTNVEIMASIDAHGDLGEYIRKGMSWTQIISNRDKLRAYPHIKFLIAPTVSVFSMRNLPVLYKECISLDLISNNDFYINILERPYQYNIKCFPLEKKQLIHQEYETFYSWCMHENIPSSIVNKFKDCINFMLEEDKSNFWNKFLVEVKKYDAIRNETYTKFDF